MPDTSGQSQVETLADFGLNPEGISKRWIAEINLFETEREDWFKRSEKVVNRYRDERQDPTRNVRRFNLFWSNVETLKPICYARLPKADVQRRFKDSDPVARLACEISERCLDYFIECNDRFDRAAKEAVEDYLLVGQGVTWQRYVPHFRTQTRKIPVSLVGLPQNSTEVEAEGAQVSNEMETQGTSDENDTGGAQLYQDQSGKQYKPEQVVTDQGDPYVEQSYDVTDYEEVLDDYINYPDWGCNAGARTWDEVYAVWRRAYLTRDEMHARFDTTIGKEKVDEIPLDYEPKNVNKGTDDTLKELFKKATIYEIWDRSSKKAIWVHKGFPDTPLDVRKDPLGLSEFFPCPQPVWATTTNNTLTPVADFLMYQDQADQIDDLTARIDVVQKAIRIRGIYAGNVDAFRTLLSDAQDNDMVPMDQATLQMLTGAGMNDLSKAVWFWPIDILVAALKVLIDLRRQLIEDVYQITGMGDIIRGQTDPNETATAQEIKSQWGGLRVKDKQKEIQRYCRDVLRIKFEIIFNHFEDDTIWMVSNAEAIPDIIKAGEEAVQQVQAQAKQQAEQQAVMAQQMGVQPLPPQPVPAQILEQAKMQAMRALFGKAMALLRNSALRHFKVDIETDSTVAPDDAAEKKRVTELLTAVGGFINQAGPVIEKAPEFVPVMGELLMYAIRRYKGGQSVESAIETAVASLKGRGSGQQDNSEAMARAEEAKAKMAGEETKRLKIQADVMDTQTNAQTAKDQQELERGKLALDGLAMERDANPQVVVN